MPEFCTIGVYGWEPDQFFDALARRHIDTFCDLRARRGVRGSAYAFANSRRLQARLVELGIHYVHRPDLAPSSETRAAQHAVDDASKIRKRARSTLSAEFIASYQQECLSDFDSATFVDSLGPSPHVVALFCVERDATACHRSLVAERLAADLGARVTHLAPEQVQTPA